MAGLQACHFPSSRSFLGSLACSLLAASRITTALVVEPSNSTHLTNGVNNAELTQLELGLRSSLVQEKMVPLTDTARSIPTDGIKGTPYLVTNENTTGSASGNIFLLDCEAPGTGAQPSDVIDTASKIKPAAILLYSPFADHCSYNPTAPDAIPVFTIVKLDNSRSIVQLITNSPAHDLHAWVHNKTAPDSASPFTATPTDNGSNKPDTTNAATSTSTKGSGSDQNPLGPSPTTAVAMIILYSITGLITGLFLIIIVTGAIRAHRHPERYGPRDGHGLPRQSRAKGIARAMLDTIPIVKFGDNRNAPKATDATEVEMGMANRGTGADGTIEANDGQPRRSGEANDDVIGVASASAAGAAGPAAATDAARSGEAAESHDTEGATMVEPNPDVLERVPTSPAPANPQHDESLGCPICTEDFEMGEDIRVLPCDHSYHPACIDPWLLNVSGTCPLCRTELRSQSSDANDAASASDPNDPVTNPTISALAAPSARSSNRISAAVADLLHLRTARDAPAEERIAALRWFRQRRAGGSRSMTSSPVPDSIPTASSPIPGDGEGTGEAGRRVRVSSRNRSREGSRNRNSWGAFKFRARPWRDSGGDGGAGVAGASSSQPS